MAEKEPLPPLVINNFTGALTRRRFGDINSGLAKFDNSFGYNPFFKPGQLTWFKAPTNVSAVVASGLVIDSCSRIESGVLYTYALTNTGHIYKIAGEGGSSVDLVTLSTGSPTFTYGGAIEFFGATDRMYIAHDKGVTSVLTDGSGETQVGTWGAAGFTAITTKRGMQQFLGNLYVINSDPSVTYANNIAEISPAGTVNTYAKLSPSLPAGTYIRDLDINADLIYLLISASLIPSELLAPVNDKSNVAASVSALYKWNGIDEGVTTGTSLPNFGVTALQSFGNSQMMFMYDTFGASLYDGNIKRITLRNNKSPMPNATASAGNFITWTSPYVEWNLDTDAATMYGALYYYGALDENSPTGLWRMFRQTSAIGGAIYQMPWNQFTTNRYLSVNTNAQVQVDSNGTHMYSFIDYSGSAGATNNHTYIFYAAPPDDSPGGWSGAIGGVYETQTQIFSKRITFKQIRVYCEPTVANNSFNLDLIGIDGKKISGGAFSYAFASGSAITSLQGSLTRINFNPSTATTFGLAVRVTNTGSANMCIPKIEIDYGYSGQ